MNLGTVTPPLTKLPPHYNRVKEDSRYKTFVALVKNEVVGFISTVQFFTVGLDGNLLWLVQMAVKREIRSKGIGTELLKL